MQDSPRRLLAACVLVVATAFARRTRAEAPVSSSLSWVRLPGAEACITATELGQRIEQHLGRTVLVSPSVAEVSIEGRVEVRGNGALRRFYVVVGGTRKNGSVIGSRELTSDGADCRALDDGLVLVVALMIDPEGGAAPAPPKPPPEAPPREVTHEIVREHIVIRETERAAPSAPPWLVESWLTGVAALERLPGATAGGALTLRTGPRPLIALELMLGLLPSTRLDVGARSVELSILEAGLAFCPAVPLGRRLQAIGCVGMRGGLVRSRGRGFTTDREVDRGLADITVGAQLGVTIAGPVFAIATANLLVPLVRQETAATNAAGRTVILDERSVLGAELGAGVGVRFSP